MARIPWREGKVLSVETRSKIFVIAQMLVAPYMAFFHLFRKHDQWDDVDLQQVDLLFCCAVARQFIRHSQATRQDIAPARFKSLPRRWISGDAEATVVTIWKGTRHQRDVMILGEKGGSLIEEDMGSDSSKVIKKRIAFSDDATIDNHELTDIRIYPELNERLYLCYKFGRNVDPLKDLMFRREIPREYNRYIDITE
jgi:hypothetical protein